MSEWMNSNLPISGSVSADLFGGSNTPKLQRELIKVNREYMYALTDGYIKAVDAMIQHLNSVEVDGVLFNKVMLVLTSLIFVEEDIGYLKNEKLTDESGKALPTLSEIQYINDVPLEFDIIQAVYLYILRVAKDSGFYSQNGVFGNLDVSGVMFNNARNLSDVYKQYVVGIDGEIEDNTSKKLAQKISDICRANTIVRERLYKLAGNGKKLSKKEEFEFRRTYKYDPVEGSVVKRAKPISNVVFALLANKNDSAYVNLKTLLK